MKQKHRFTIEDETDGGDGANAVPLSRPQKKSRPRKAQVEKQSFIGNQKIFG